MSSKKKVWREENSIYRWKYRKAFVNRVVFEREAWDLGNILRSTDEEKITKEKENHRQRFLGRKE